MSYCGLELLDSELFVLLRWRGQAPIEPFELDEAPQPYRPPFRMVASLVLRVHVLQHLRLA